jgi:hypothetical protein
MAEKSIVIGESAERIAYELLSGIAAKRRKLEGSLEAHV